MKDKKKVDISREVTPEKMRAGRIKALILTRKKG